MNKLLSNMSRRIAGHVAVKCDWRLPILMYSNFDAFILMYLLFKYISTVINIQQQLYKHCTIRIAIMNMTKPIIFLE